MEVSAGRRPARPVTEDCIGEFGISDSLWELIQCCWAQDPAARPSATDALEYFVDMEKGFSSMEERQEVGSSYTQNEGTDNDTETSGSDTAVDTGDDYETKSKLALYASLSRRGISIQHQVSPMEVCELLDLLQDVCFARRSGWQVH
jgi:hypothetical protein